MGMKLNKQTRDTQSLHIIQVHHIKVVQKSFIWLRNIDLMQQNQEDNKNGSLISTKS